jgi:hypothetical protein
VQLARRNGLARQAHHKGLVPKLVDVGATDRNQGTKVKLKTVDMRGRCAAGAPGKLRAVM